VQFAHAIALQWYVSIDGNGIGPDADDPGSRI
jgi:hypothetical protein